MKPTGARDPTQRDTMSNPANDARSAFTAASKLLSQIESLGCSPSAEQLEIAAAAMNTHAAYLDSAAGQKLIAALAPYGITPPAPAPVVEPQPVVKPIPVPRVATIEHAAAARPVAPVAAESTATHGYTVAPSARFPDTVYPAPPGSAEPMTARAAVKPIADWEVYLGTERPKFIARCAVCSRAVDESASTDPSVQRAYRRKTETAKGAVAHLSCVLAAAGLEVPRALIPETAKAPQPVRVTLKGRAETSAQPEPQQAPAPAKPQPAPASKPATAPQPAPAGSVDALAGRVAALENGIQAILAALGG